jgi:two-component system phosphate regulon sensor histidine kinase PhoR
MRRRRLIWQLFPAFLILILFAITATTWYAVDLVRNFYFEQINQDLEVRARLLMNIIETDLINEEFDSIEKKAGILGKEIGTRITIILPDGKVIADSEENPEIMDNHLDRPEVREALREDIGSSVRYSSTIERDLMYLALPLRHNNEILAFVRTSKRLRTLEETIAAVQRKFTISGLVVLGIAILISLWVSRRVSRPLEEMTTGVERFAQGDFNLHLPVPPSFEMSKLADALNQMAVQLDEKIKTIVQQKNEQNGILESMEEGVLAIDQEERVITINKAAANMLRIKEKQVQGRDVREIVRNSQLQNIITNTIQSGKLQEAEIVVRSKSEKNVQVHGTVLKDTDENTIGAVIVLNDVTQLRRLENGRREFVANVSHEIRTPLTSIKGFVEALKEGAIKDEESTQRFLDIIDRQTNRLNTIIEDLLTLSRLESDGERDEILFQEADINELIQNAIHICQPAAEKKNITLNNKCENEVFLRINSPLIEEALINLVDNAVKYSPEGSSVDIRCKQQDKEMALQVRDEGPGIAPEHLPRIFERFYRVDRARSRKMGGTGLGLAIVKHIALIHGGRVEVKSTLGKGSKFRIYLPA